MHNTISIPGISHRASAFLTIIAWRLVTESLNPNIRGMALWTAPENQPLRPGTSSQASTCSLPGGPFWSFCISYSSVLDGSPLAPLYLPIALVESAGLNGGPWKISNTTQ